MHSRSLTKLFSTPVAKLTWSQIQQIKQLRQNKKNLHCSSFIKSYDNLFINKENVAKYSSKQKHLSKELSKVCANGFSSSTSHSFWNKLTTCDQQQFQVPGELYAHKAELEPVLVEGIGWAGQPIVRRTHPILPEVYGDISDIFTAVEKLPGCRKAQEEALFSQSTDVSKVVNVNAQLQSVNLEGKEGFPNNPQFVKDHLVHTNKTKGGAEAKNPPSSPDAISIMHENIKSGSHKQLPSKETNSGPDTVKDNSGVKRKTGGQVVTKVGLISKKDKRLQKLKNMHLSSELVPSSQKKKSKKRTKVYSSKPNIHQVPLETKTKSKKSKKKNLSIFGENRKRYTHQPNILLNHQVSAQPVKKSGTVLAYRQIQTYSQANRAKVSINVKEKTSTTIVALAKKQVKGSKLASEGKYPEDCKCPEIIETKSRFPTKICGEAAGAKDKKKKKEWKGKMCPVEHKSNYRRRTFVCSSAKFGKAKRKRQLPKCVKPEKKVAPRVLVCPPVLEDELLKKEKKCVKQVEEVKIRSRTKVCKPVIIHQREEAKVVVQKSVCIEKKVKKTISRHTKVCPPSEQNDSQKKSKR